MGWLISKIPILNNQFKDRAHATMLEFKCDEGEVQQITHIDSKGKDTNPFAESYSLDPIKVGIANVLDNIELQEKYTGKQGVLNTTDCTAHVCAGIQAIINGKDINSYTSEDITNIQTEMQEGNQITLDYDDTEGIPEQDKTRVVNYEDTEEIPEQDKTRLLDQTLKNNKESLRNISANLQSNIGDATQSEDTKTRKTNKQKGINQKS